MLSLILGEILIIVGVCCFEGVISDDRIVGGSCAVPGQIPYIVSLRRVVSGSHFCGGSVIHPSYVLTAGHCVEALQPEEISIVAGTTELNSVGTQINCQNIILHPGYNRQRLTNDVSLIATTSTIQFNNFIQPIAIAKGSVPDKSQALISGWGLLRYDGSLPNQLQFLDTTVISNDECRARHNILNRRFVYDNVICSYTHVNEGICLGDSGGALVVSNILVGVMSWVVPCGKGLPDAYARISSHYDWIVAQISENTISGINFPPSTVVEI